MSLRSLTLSQPVTARGVTNAHGQLRLRTDADGLPLANTQRPLVLDSVPRKPLSPPARTGLTLKS